MKNLYSKLLSNNRVDRIVKKLKPSLEEEDEINLLVVVLKTRFNRYEWAKSLYISHSKKGGFDVLVHDSPDDVIKPIFDKFKGYYYSPSYGHEKQIMRFYSIDEENIVKIINWMYSAKLN